MAWKYFFFIYAKVLLSCDEIRIDKTYIFNILWTSTREISFYLSLHKVWSSFIWNPLRLVIFVLGIDFIFLLVNICTVWIGFGGEKGRCNLMKYYYYYSLLKVYKWKTKISLCYYRNLTTTVHLLAKSKNL